MTFVLMGVTVVACMFLRILLVEGGGVGAALLGALGALALLYYFY